MGRTLIFLCLVVSGCSNVELTPAPDPLYNKDEMAQIMFDLYLLDGTLQTNRRAFLETKVRPDSFMYAKYNTDSLTYARNLQYYTDRVEDYVEILEQVEEKIKARAAEIEKLREETSTELIPLDSTRTVQRRNRS